MSGLMFAFPGFFRLDPAKENEKKTDANGNIKQAFQLRARYWALGCPSEPGF